MGVFVKGIGIGRKFIHECQGVGLRYDSREVRDDAGDIGDEWEGKAELIEDVGGGAENVA